MHFLNGIVSAAITLVPSVRRYFISNAYLALSPSSSSFVLLHPPPFPKELATPGVHDRRTARRRWRKKRRKMLNDYQENMV